MTTRQMEVATCVSDEPSNYLGGFWETATVSRDDSGQEVATFQDGDRVPLSDIPDRFIRPVLTSKWEQKDGIYWVPDQWRCVLCTSMVFDDKMALCPQSYKAHGTSEEMPYPFNCLPYPVVMPCCGATVCYDCISHDSKVPGKLNTSFLYCPQNNSAEQNQKNNTSKQSCNTEPQAGNKQGVARDLSKLRLKCRNDVRNHKNKEGLSAVNADLQRDLMKFMKHIAPKVYNFNKGKKSSSSEDKSNNVSHKDWTITGDFITEYVKIRGDVSDQAIEANRQQSSTSSSSSSSSSSSLEHMEELWGTKHVQQIDVLALRATQDFLDKEQQQREQAEKKKQEQEELSRLKVLELTKNSSSSRSTLAMPEQNKKRKTFVLKGIDGELDRVYTEGNQVEAQWSDPRSKKGLAEGKW